uniref:LCCL domain-containing protein n=1 Tax=Chromera velia CCMP2878 TaxID=1169474 RepID=A0A0G4HYR7_9ALVE|eukprot:Cvel_9552.t1-p1 / transcript=Cvel_9552.t1 / gene=Cvel_9552 / organism=Chromera_velia_CCMP2878 / gene_product=Cysteine-rich secretory protein LCCL, putative / transcript_product=Cysteine-rich secretory protein LCCL, putative / location=Cvel_scaffold553:48192-48874(+) / protein_length=203 / sequence_SO=supercontig / SO=protein_coding / is_pseudo=false
MPHSLYCSPQVRVHCPAECQTSDAKVFGEMKYSPKSSICKAAIHAGKLSPSGGAVNVVLGGRFDRFIGSVSNGVESKASRKAHIRTFSLSQAEQSPEYKCDDTGMTIINSGKPALVTCPKDCASAGSNVPFFGSAKVYGTGTYNPESAVCRAAIHAGVLDSERGGETSIAIVEQPDDLPKGSTAHGVSSSDASSARTSLKYIT